MKKMNYSLLGLLLFSLSLSSASSAEVTDFTQVSTDTKATYTDISTELETVAEDESFEGEIITVYKEDFLNEEALSNYVSETLQQTKIAGVSVLEKRVEHRFTTFAAPIHQWRATGTGYKICYNGQINDSYGSVIHKVAAEPGTTIGLNLTKSVSAAITGTGGVNTTIINVTVGFTTSKSYSVTYSGSYKVEATVNKKKVKYLTMSAKPIYNNYSFSTIKNGTPSASTFVARKPIGIIYTKSYTYYK